MGTRGIYHVTVDRQDGAHAHASSHGHTLTLGVRRGDPTGIVQVRYRLLLDSPDMREALPTIDLPDASVDRAWGAFVFHEVDLPEQLASELRRVVRSDGRVGILDWRPDASSGGGPPRAHRLRSEQVKDYLQAAGFPSVAQTWQDESAYLVEAGEGVARL